MKTKIKNIITAYKVLGEAKVSKLEESEVIKIIKARKEMRPIAESYESFLKDCQEKFKIENWDEFQAKLQQWQEEGENTTLTEDERKEINKILIEYARKVDSAVKDELEREVELNIETLKSDSITKLIIENNWELKKIEDIEIMA